MADNYLIVGSNNIEFGTAGVGYTAVGTIVSASRKDGAQKLEIKNRKGNTTIVVYFDKRNECEIQVIFDSTVTLPNIGDSLSLCGLTTVLVDEITHNWENERERMVTIRATRHEALVTS